MTRTATFFVILLSGCSLATHFEDFRSADQQPIGDAGGFDSRIPSDDAASTSDVGDVRDASGLDANQNDATTGACEVRLSLDVTGQRGDGSPIVENQFGRTPVITSRDGQIACGGLQDGRAARQCEICVARGTTLQLTMNIPWLEVSRWDAPNCNADTRACEVTMTEDRRIGVTVKKTASLIFATSLSITGKFGDPALGSSEANILCAQARERANTPDDVVPLVFESDGSVPQSLLNGAGWVRAHDGVLIARRPRDFENGTMTPVLYDEMGELLEADDVAWAGAWFTSNSRGVLNCANWTVDDASQEGAVSHPAVAGPRGTQGRESERDKRPCGMPVRLICAEDSDYMYTPASR